MSSFVRRQMRRKVSLELLSLTVPIASAVFFSGWLIAGWPRAICAVAAGCAVLVLSAYWLWHRSRFPANIDPPSDDKDDKDDKDEDDDEGGWWDPFTILLFVVSAVALVVVGIVARFVLPLLIIAVFSVGFGPGLGDVALVVLATLGVSFVLEFAIVIPLSKLWNLDIEGESERGSTSCPTAADQP